MTHPEGGHRAVPPYRIPQGRGGTHPPARGEALPIAQGAYLCSGDSAHQVVGAGGEHRCGRGRRGRRGRQPASALTAGHGGAQQGLEGAGVTAALQGGAQTDCHQPDRQRDPGGPGLAQVELDPGQRGKG